MKLVHAIKVIFSLLLSALFLASTGGLSIYEHYCSCSEILKISIESPVHEGCCDNQHDVPVSGKPIVCGASCCSQSDEFHQPGEDHRSHNCCTDKVIVLKTDVFNPVKVSTLQKPFLPLFYIREINTSELLSETCKQELTYDHHFKNKPPEKNIIIFTHQLRIPSNPACRSIISFKYSGNSDIT